MSLPPGPKISPLVTSYHWLRRPFAFFDETAARYGDAFSMRLLGLPPLAVFSNPETVKEIFADDGDLLLAGKFNLSLKAFLGECSILMLDRKEHLRHRRLLLPPFHGERMAAYGQAMIDLTHDAFDALPLGKPFAVHGILQSVTLRVIVRTVFGIEAGPQFEDICAKVGDVLERASWAPLLLPFMQADLGRFSPWGGYLRAQAASHALILAEIRARRASGARRSDILSLLLDAKDEEGQPMTDAELLDELVTLLVAGHETTATALAWALRWVLDSQDTRERLVAEIRGLPSATPARIAELPLLDAIVRETLRLQPVVPIVGRILDRDATIGGHALPAGTGVVCSIYLAQRRSQVYEDPTRFVPERFMGRKFTPQEFFPFGGGVRRCVGMAFALYEMKMVLATVFARVHLRLAPGKPIKVVRRSITLTPSDGLQVLAEARKARMGMN